MEDLETEEDIKRFRENYIYLDKFISDIASLRGLLVYDFDVLNKFFYTNNESLGRLEKFRKAFFFKLDRLLDCLLDLEKDILNSSMDHYYSTIHGKEHSMDKVIKKVTNSADLFLTQFFSLFDLFIKAISDLSKEKLPDNVDSIGSLYVHLSKNKSKTIFQPLVELKKEFLDFKNYRDYLIHHGNLSIEPTRSRENPEYSLDKFYMYHVERKGKKEYEDKSDYMHQVNILIRFNLKKQLEVFHKILNLLRE